MSKQFEQNNYDVEKPKRKSKTDDISHVDFWKTIAIFTMATTIVGVVIDGLSSSNSTYLSSASLLQNAILPTVFMLIIYRTIHIMATYIMRGKGLSSGIVLQTLWWNFGIFVGYRFLLTVFSKTYSSDIITGLIAAVWIIWAYGVSKIISSYYNISPLRSWFALILSHIVVIIIAFTLIMGFIIWAVSSYNGRWY